MSNNEIKQDNVNHPQHYNQYPVEVIDIVENMPFCMGNVIKYALRAPYKNNIVEDCRKAQWYLDRQYKLVKENTEQILYYDYEALNQLKEFLIQEKNKNIEDKRTNKIISTTIAFLLMVEDFCSDPLEEQKYKNLKDTINFIADIGN